MLVVSSFRKGRWQLNDMSRTKLCQSDGCIIREPCFELGREPPIFITKASNYENTHTKTNELERLWTNSSYYMAQPKSPMEKSAVQSCIDVTHCTQIARGGGRRGACFNTIVFQPSIWECGQVKPKRKGLNSTEARELMVLFSFYVVDILRIHRFIRAGASEVVVQDSYEWGGGGWKANKHTGARRQLTLTNIQKGS
jgi:hypothetical protein